MPWRCRPAGTRDADTVLSNDSPAVFDPDDVAHLRRVLGSTGAPAAAQPMHASDPTPVVRDTQLNVRVRAETKARAQQLAKAPGATLASVIERAVDDLYADMERRR